MNFIETKLKGAYIIEVSTWQDERGIFARTYCKKEFKKINHTQEFVQFNHSSNNQIGTLRGMHYQKNPFAEIKLIRCIRGSVFDVIVDIRKSSPTFLKWIGIELSAKNMKMIYVPRGFAHGFLTLENDSELLYHHTDFHEPSAECGIKYDDPSLNIDWPGRIMLISAKDKGYPTISKNFKGIKS